LLFVLLSLLFVLLSLLFVLLSLLFVLCSLFFVLCSLFNNSILKIERKVTEFFVTFVGRIFK